MGELDGWRFCPRCANEVAREDDGSKAECPNCGSRFYASSKITACAVCVDERGRVLLARRAGPPFEGRWDLPGGFVQEGEHPHDAIRRELEEETSLTVQPLDFVGVWMDTYSEDGDGGDATLNLYWTARVVSGEPEGGEDVAELRWFGRDELPHRDDLAFHIGEVLSAWVGRYEQA